MNKNIYNHRNIILLQNKVLKLREKLFGKIHNYIKMMTANSDFTSVVISINLKGFPKNFEKLNIVFNSIIEFFEKFFLEKRIISCKLFVSMLGLTVVILIKESPVILKYISYKIEENLRFLDIDIFYGN
ncbi:MAG: citrate lyase holo-[acyl-carrier protein] synthase, partial [Exilispira sp.]